MCEYNIELFLDRRRERRWIEIFGWAAKLEVLEAGKTGRSREAETSPGLFGLPGRRMTLSIQSSQDRSRHEKGKKCTTLSIWGVVAPVGVTETRLQVPSRDGVVLRVATIFDGPVIVGLLLTIAAET